MQKEMPLTLKAIEELKEVVLMQAQDKQKTIEKIDEIINKIKENI